MDIKATDLQLTQDLNGSVLATFKIDRADTQIIKMMFDELKEKSISLAVSEWHKKRSLTANAYAWVLLQELALKLNLGLVEVYKQHIKECGVYQDIQVNERAEKTFIRSWERNGQGWLCERVDSSEGFAVLRAYYGSSVYNTKQMARLIDLIVQDCEALGIPTKTPAEIANLVSLWGAK